MEIGVFERKEEGLREVTNPSEIFLAERPEGASGSAVVSSLEGTRTILVEVQSLVCPTLFGVPRRTVVGVDYNKVILLAAVLEKKAGIQLANHDIFLKVAGGMRLEEPAIDNFELPR
jgi:DNA repair protein RadA/Sms